jgi:uncharacterized protein YjbI with pentapeptide repeats
MLYEIMNRFTGKVQFVAEIDCAEDAPKSVKIGLSVKWAIKAHANLAHANLAHANLADANLVGANLAGAYLADADLAGANLAHANLVGAYLADANLAGANLAGAYLAGANLADANLADANLVGANLAGAYLADADLAGDVDIRPEEVPVIPQIDAAILAAIEAGGTLDMQSWHGKGGVCGTTHCRAGWAVHLGGEKGKALESKVGSQMAGAMIYRASRPGKSPPWFFASDDEAIADIRQCAAEDPLPTRAGG